MCTHVHTPGTKLIYKTWLTKLQVENKNLWKPGGNHSFSHRVYYNYCNWSSNWAPESLAARAEKGNGINRTILVTGKEELVCGDKDFPGTGESGGSYASFFYRVLNHIMGNVLPSLFQPVQMWFSYSRLLQWLPNTSWTHVIKEQPRESRLRVWGGLFPCCEKCMVLLSMRILQV